MNLNQNFEPIEPERLLTPAHGTNGCGTGKIWSAFGSGQLGLAVLGPANRVLLSELDGPVVNDSDSSNY
jgi:hypothetical protein